MYRKPACQEILATKHLLASNSWLGYFSSLFMSASLNIHIS